MCIVYTLYSVYVYILTTGDFIICIFILFTANISGKQDVCSCLQVPLSLGRCCEQSDRLSKHMLVFRHGAESPK